MFVSLNHYYIHHSALLKGSTGKKMHLSETYMDLTVWISFEILKFGRNDHIFDKKLIEKTYFVHFSLVIVKSCQKIYQKM